MATFVKYHLVDELVRSWLAAATQKQVGLARIPAKDTDRDELDGKPLTNPYVVLYPMTSPRGEGSMAQPEEDRELIYQITNVGVDPKQVRWMSDKCRDVFLTMSGADGYLFPLDITTAGGAVQCRYSDSVGATLPSGVDLYNSHDSYRLRVGA